MRAGTNNPQKSLRITLIFCTHFGKHRTLRYTCSQHGHVPIQMPPSHTKNKKGEKTVCAKTTCAKKKGFTVALAATASGTKLPAVIIFKERGGSLGVSVQRSICIPSNVRVRATTNGWMTAEEYQLWLVHVYGKECKQLMSPDR